jgi:hypothetical protein
VTASITARLGATIVHLPPVRAVVMHDECLVVVNQGADSELDRLVANLDIVCKVRVCVRVRVRVCVCV